MDTTLLTYQNTQLTPEARWLVMQWSSLIGLDQSVECSLQTLFARLGLTYAQGRRAWDVLTGEKGANREQFIDIERLPSHGPGRPASRYRLSAKLVKELADTLAPACKQHAEEIIALARTTRLSTIDEKIDLIEGGRLRGTGLTLPNRWLLMVLLAHADSPGIVTRLSVSAIHRLTGMSRYRITSQLNKLSDLGIIAHHQPGRYSPQANARKTSIYLLDLAHPSLGTFKRAPLTIMSPPSTKSAKRTELVGGVVDAAMTVGVCNLQIEAFLKEYDAITDSKSTLSVGTKEKHKYNDLVKTLHNAQALLPSTDYLDDGVEELLKRYDAEDANWLLTSVHIDACHLLTSYWNKLKEGFCGPDQPCHDVIVSTARRLGIALEYEIEADLEQETESASEKDSDYTKALDDQKPRRSPEVEPITEQTSYPPLALLFYALSHHLAKQLQSAFKLNEYEKAEAMTFMLVPAFFNAPDGPTLPGFQLRSYGLSFEDTDKEPTTIIFRRYVAKDLNTYWQTHHQDCLSAINNEPNDPTESDAQEPTDS